MLSDVAKTGPKRLLASVQICLGEIYYSLGQLSRYLHQWSSGRLGTLLGFDFSILGLLVMKWGITAKP